jgi:hypothetical protein
MAAYLSYGFIFASGFSAGTAFGLYLHDRGRL